MTLLGMSSGLFRVGKLRFSAKQAPGEAVFQPSFIGKKASGIQDTTFQSILVNMDIHSDVKQRN